MGDVVARKIRYPGKQPYEWQLQPLHRAILKMPMYLAEMEKLVPVDALAENELYLHHDDGEQNCERHMNSVHAVPRKSPIFHIVAGSHGYYLVWVLLPGLLPCAGTCHWFVPHIQSIFHLV